MDIDRPKAVEEDTKEEKIARAINVLAHHLKVYPKAVLYALEDSHLIDPFLLDKVEKEM